MVCGLRGGHSGINIHEGRAQRPQAPGPDPGPSPGQFPFALYRLEGGNKHNAIPREAWADVYLEPAKIKAFSAFLQAAGDQIKAEYQVVEPGLKLGLRPDRTGSEGHPPDAEKPENPPRFPGLLPARRRFDAPRDRRPRRDVDQPGHPPDGRGQSQDPLLQPELRRFGPGSPPGRLKALADISGAKVKQPAGYPGWTPNLQSPLLQKMKAVHRAVTGKEAADHGHPRRAGMRPDREKFPGMDMISLGPTLQYPHSPDERVEIASVENFWKLLLASLEALA